MRGKSLVRLSRLNGSSWISFRSRHSQQFEPSPETRFTGFLSEEDPDRRVPEKKIGVQSSEQPEVMQEVPMVVPSRAWVDEVKTLKQGDIHVGRGSKQRGLLPSFWANRYKVSKFGRDRAIELHRAEVQENPRYGLKVHELFGKRLLCHCSQNEKCHADNIRDLFRDWHPHAFDPSSSERPPLSIEHREDSEESGLEDAEADAPQGWPGTGKPMVLGSGYVERRLCDGQGLCSPFAWAPEDRQYPSSQLSASISRLFLGTAESISTVQRLSELDLGRLVKSPFRQDVVGRIQFDVLKVTGRTCPSISDFWEVC